MRCVNEVGPCGADGKLYPPSKLIVLDGNEDHRRTDGLKMSQVGLRLRMYTNLLKNYDCSYGTDGHSDVKNRSGH